MKPQRGWDGDLPGSDDEVKEPSYKREKQVGSTFWEGSPPEVGRKLLGNRSAGSSVDEQTPSFTFCRTPLEEEGAEQSGALDGQELVPGHPWWFRDPLVPLWWQLHAAP